MEQLHGRLPSLDFGTKPTTAKCDDIKVQINPELMVKDFATSYYHEMQRRNPLKAAALVDQAKARAGVEEGNPLIDELYYYFQGLLKIRVESVHNNCPNWRRAKVLYIPAWIETAICNVGRVVDVAHGLVFLPQFEFAYDIDKMIVISNMLESFTTDGIVMHRDAFPRGPEGNADVMSLAIINDFVQGMNVVPPVASYITAFLGMKLCTMGVFETLYRVRYDDVNFIKTMLINESSIF